MVLVVYVYMFDMNTCFTFYFSYYFCIKNGFLDFEKVITD